MRFWQQKSHQAYGEAKRDIDSVLGILEALDDYFESEVLTNQKLYHSFFFG